MPIYTEPLSEDASGDGRVVDVDPLQKKTKLEQRRIQAERSWGSCCFPQNSFPLQKRVAVSNNTSYDPFDSVVCDSTLRGPRLAPDPWQKTREKVALPKRSLIDWGACEGRNRTLADGDLEP
ncbi:hypothetical protein EVAR_22295_1 [Eumeta japonica]|uniref:Uncharacterized protein n=1 Tax=Eumeta variegata TaxID=151549 RepID=A0A4C1UBV7_EUMVA|nr:hypothetical protein EVAR_22295_1 [Eumeta japonica]